MPPVAKIRKSVVLYDLNAENQMNLRRALFKVYTYNYLHTVKNLSSLVLVNAERTDNRMNAQNSNKFKHIVEVDDTMREFDPSLIYDKIEIKNSDQSNWKEALRVAVQILIDEAAPNVISYQLLYLTDLSHSIQSDESLVTIKNTLRNLNIYLYIVGPNVDLPISLTSFDGISNILKDAVLENENNNVLETLGLLEDHCKVVVSNIRFGLQFYLNFAAPDKKQAWSVPLRIGEKISIPVEIYLYLESGKELCLVPVGESECPQYNYVDAQDSSKVYEEDDVRTGITRHGKFVLIQDNDMFKLETQKSFSLCFFTPTDSIPEYMLKGPTTYLVTASTKEPSEAFTILQSKLKSKKRSMIVERVYCKGNSPSYWALLPAKDYFVGVPLPYDHEVKLETKDEKLKKNLNPVANEVSNFLSSITIDSPDCSLKPVMTPNLTTPSLDSVLVERAADKMLNENLNLQMILCNAHESEIDQKIKQELSNYLPPMSTFDDDDVKEEIEDDSDYDDDCF